MTKLTDYGFVLLSYLARQNYGGSWSEPASRGRGPTPSGDNGGLPHPRLFNARDLAERTNLPLPVVGKILKQLAKAGLLLSHRGVKGGYGLARDPDLITAAQVISALEGPIAITQCSEDHTGPCELARECQVGGHWQRINSALNQTLEGITLEELTARHPPVETGGL